MFTIDVIENLKDCWYIKISAILCLIFLSGCSNTSNSNYAKIYVWNQTSSKLIEEER